MLVFERTKRTDWRLLDLMEIHYSQPKGFVGRNLCYAILYDGRYYGHIVGGSATRFLPGRNEFLEIDISQLNLVVNNIFFHIHKVDNRYPRRNFVPFVIEKWTGVVAADWEVKYGDSIVGFESLVELPRTGECYRRAGWTKIGQTKGYACKRVAGRGTDNWTGKRVWDTENLRPKWVYTLKWKETDLSRATIEKQMNFKESGYER